MPILTCLDVTPPFPLWETDRQPESPLANRRLYFSTLALDTVISGPDLQSTDSRHSTFQIACILSVAEVVISNLSKSEALCDIS
jgi:hypothetical protein